MFLVVLKDSLREWTKEKVDIDMKQISGFVNSLGPTISIGRSMAFS